MLVVGLLAIACYVTALVGDFASDAAPALRRHASAFSAAGGLFLVVEVWLGWRLRKSER